MIRKPLGLATLLFAAVVALVGGATTARAEYFDFQTTPAFDSTGLPFASPGGGNTIFLTPQGASGTPHENASGTGTNIAFGNIFNITTATPVAVNLSYSFDIVITDYASPTSTIVTGGAEFLVTGTLTGSIGNFQSNLINTYTGVTDLGQFGPTTYTFSFPAQDFAKPGARPTSEGAFTGHLTATTVPEPASMALVGLGLVGFAGRTLARRKKTA